MKRYIVCIVRNVVGTRFIAPTIYSVSAADAASAHNICKQDFRKRFSLASNDIVCVSICELHDNYSLSPALEYGNERTD